MERKKEDKKEEGDKISKPNKRNCQIFVVYNYKRPKEDQKGEENYLEMKNS